MQCRPMMLPAPPRITQFDTAEYSTSDPLAAVSLTPPSPATTDLTQWVGPSRAGSVSDGSQTVANASGSFTGAALLADSLFANYIDANIDLGDLFAAADGHSAGFSFFSPVINVPASTAAGVSAPGGAETPAASSNPSSASPPFSPPPNNGFIYPFLPPSANGNLPGAPQNNFDGPSGHGGGSGGHGKSSDPLFFSASTYEVTEDQSSVTITVDRSGARAGTVSVNYATSDGTATAGVDYVATQGTLTFGPGVAAQTFAIQILGDPAPDGPQTVTLTLSNPQGADISAPNPATLTIDDPPVLMQFDRLDTTVYEDSGTATIQVDRLGDTSGTSTVDYNTRDGTAIAGVDYTPVSGTLTFNPGDTYTTIIVPILNDGQPDGIEDFTVNLTNPTGGYLGNATTDDVTVSDPATPTVFFDQSNFSVDESSGTATIQVDRSGDLSQQSTVYYSTSDGTAIAGTDYTAAPNVLTFNQDDSIATFTVPILNDGLIDGTEYLNLTLSNPTNATLGAPYTSTLSIDDPVTSDPQLALVAGYVWLDQNANGLQDQSETGVAGVAVNLLANGSIVQTTTTDQGGDYMFWLSDTSPTYQVQVIPTGAYTPTIEYAGDPTIDSDINASGFSDPFTVPAGSSAIVDAGLIGNPAQVVGQVWLDSNRDGLQETGENGMPNITVDLVDNRLGQMASTTTDANGNFTFSGVAAGATYQIHVEIPSGYLATIEYAGSPSDDSNIDANGDSDWFTPDFGQTIDSVNAGLTPVQPATVQGDVWADANGNGIQDTGESGVPNVTAELLDANSNVVGTTATGANGNYSFNNLTAGQQYSLQFVAPNGAYFTQPYMDSSTDDSSVDSTGRSQPFQLTSGQVLTVSAGVVYTATPVDDDYLIPDGETYFVSASEGVLTNDLGPQGAMTAQLVSGPDANLGSVQLNNDGSFVFTPGPGESTATDPIEFIYALNVNSQYVGTATVKLYRSSNTFAFGVKEIDFAPAGGQYIWSDDGKTEYNSQQWYNPTLGDKPKRDPVLFVQNTDVTIPTVVLKPLFTHLRLNPSDFLLTGTFMGLDMSWHKVQVESRSPVLCESSGGSKRFASVLWNREDG